MTTPDKHSTRPFLGARIHLYGAVASIILQAAVLLLFRARFRPLLSGLGVELPLLTKIVIDSPTYLFVLCNVAVIVGLLLKERFVRHTTAKVVINGLVFFGSIGMFPLAAIAAYLPMIGILDQIK